MKTWGFLRETNEAAMKAGIDKATGLPRTGLEDYLAVIFPNVKDWEHDKPILDAAGKMILRYRPDYWSKSLKMIVEFDGVQHYTDPGVIVKDKDKDCAYKELKYKVVRIPYFIQLTREAVKELFGVDVQMPLFDEKYASLGPTRGSPAYLCSAGLQRMARDFLRFPQQYEVNIKALRESNNEPLSGADLLEEAYKEVCKSKRQ